MAAISSFQPIRHNSFPLDNHLKRKRANDILSSMSSTFRQSQGLEYILRHNMSANKDPQSASDSGLSAASDFSDKSFLRRHHHSLSGSTFDSNDSSPTTTCSLVDDSSTTETSPGSSPESPPPSGVFLLGMQRPQSNEESRPFFELQPTALPKKGRNLKNLAVNTSAKPGMRPTLTALPPALQRGESAPVMSPTFVKPPSPPKRKPTNLGLTILTPSNSSPQQMRLMIPVTPGLARPATLRHFQSSPSLPLLTGFGHEQKDPRLGPLDAIFSPLEPIAKSPLEEEEPNYDIPLSREDKPEAYPHGPITIYGPYIDLYLEPTAAQAREYDVVMNVASEVVNPFEVTDQLRLPEPEIRLDGGGGISYKKKVQVEASPTTPKATPLTNTFSNSPVHKEPEYIHMRWEHNSDIVPDLLRLVRLIDERVQEHKKILIHCQCGVSRSASLVVAYGLYKNPAMSVQEAYDAVKRKSKWIGPNMNLIMQLQEFRSSLAHGGVLATDRNLSPITPASALGEWRSPFSMQDAEHPNGTASAGLLNGFPQDMTSLTTPLENPLTAGARTTRPRATSAVRRTSAYVDPAGHVVPVVSFATPISPTTARSTGPETLLVTSPRSEEFAMTSLQPAVAVDSMDAFGLMSPTTSSFAPPFDRSSLLASLGMTQDASAIPIRSKSLRQEAPKEQLAAPKRLHGRLSSPNLKQQKHLQSLQAQIQAQLPPRMDETSDEDALMSPRAETFTRNPFALAFDPAQDLASDTRTPVIDPRSPAQKGSSPIIRNIEDFL